MTLSVHPRDAASAAVVPIILAAGDSSRMGHPKALLPLGDQTFLTAILVELGQLGFPPPRVILGRDAHRIEPLIRGRRLQVFINQDPGRGQLSSIQLGLANVDPGCEGCLVWPVDQPGVPRHVVLGLLDLFLSGDAPIALPCYGDRRGHPAIFRHDLFWELMHASPEGGAKQLVSRYRDQTAVLITDEPSTVEDIDTPEDYFIFTGETLEAALARTSGK